jgi:ABC-type branched-subunit amino acid transport system substrate-binding protein
MEKKRRSAFPPRLGWLPVGVGLAAVTALSVWAASPQFDRQVIGAVPSNGAAGGGVAADSPGAGGGPAGAPVSGGAAAAGGGAAQSAQHTGGVAGSGGNGAQCAPGRNGGATAPGVTGSEIHVASTIVTTGEGSGFLGEAVDGMQAAINEANGSGGICGRRVTLSTINDNWDQTSGENDISNFINAGNVFAMVAEPDSQGLGAAIDSKTIDRAQIPVVGSDGMLKDQYNDPWVWPVAASTVTNMHIAAQYAVNTLRAKTFGIVFDTTYKFGKEGAVAFDHEVKRLTGQDIPGFAQNADGNGCVQAYCGIGTNGNSDFTDPISKFNGACQSNGGSKPCDVVVMLLEPQPMETWMNQEAQCGCTWYSQLMGGEPLFDNNLGGNCNGECSGMMVWTGYHAAIQPFDSEKPVYTYVQSLQAVCPSCDAHNEFTEGAYLGTKLFLEACRRVGPNLTRAALQQVLNTQTFDLGLSTPLHYGTSLPHVANTAMAAFSDNAPPKGSFNGWTYRATGFLQDPPPIRDLQ